MPKQSLAQTLTDEFMGFLQTEGSDELFARSADLKRQTLKFFNRLIKEKTPKGRVARQGLENMMGHINLWAPVDAPELPDIMKRFIEQAGVLERLGLELYDLIPPFQDVGAQTEDSFLQDIQDTAFQLASSLFMEQFVNDADLLLEEAGALLNLAQPMVSVAGQAIDQGIAEIEGGPAPLQLVDQYDDIIPASFILPDAPRTPKGTATQTPIQMPGTSTGTQATVAQRTAATQLSWRQQPPQQPPQPMMQTAGIQVQPQRVRAETQTTGTGPYMVLDPNSEISQFGTSLGAEMAEGQPRPDQNQYALVQYYNNMRQVGSAAAMLHKAVLDGRLTSNQNFIDNYRFYSGGSAAAASALAELTWGALTGDTMSNNWMKGVVGPAITYGLQRQGVRAAYAIALSKIIVSGVKKYGVASIMILKKIIEEIPNIPPHIERMVRTLIMEASALAEVHRQLGNAPPALLDEFSEQIQIDDNARVPVNTAPNWVDPPTTGRNGINDGQIMAPPPSGYKTLQNSRTLNGVPEGVKNVTVTRRANMSNIITMTDTTKRENIADIIRPAQVTRIPRTAPRITARPDGRFQKGSIEIRRGMAAQSQEYKERSINDRPFIVGPRGEAPGPVYDPINGTQTTPVNTGASDAPPAGMSFNEQLRQFEDVLRRTLNEGIKNIKIEDKINELTTAMQKYSSKHRDKKVGIDKHITGAAVEYAKGRKSKDRQLLIELYVSKHYFVYEQAMAQMQATKRRRAQKVQFTRPVINQSQYF